MVRSGSWAAAFVSAVSSSSGTPVTRKDGPDDTVVIATDDSYGQHVASSSGLGDSDAFTEAVPDADGAHAVAYVDIAAVVDSYGQGMGDEERVNLAPLSAVGLSSSTDGDRGELRLRLTTR